MLPLHRVDLNLFVVFDAIYAKRNLTRAAEQLCITQPAVSNALARLRRTFNDPLFVSTASGMVPTPVAENMVGRVAEALQLLNSSVQEGNRFEPATAEKTFRVSMSDLAETLLLPALGRVLEHEAPGLRIESYYTSREDVSRQLASGMLDLAVDAPLLNDPQLHLTPMMEERYVCMLRRDHPLAAAPLALDDYLSLGHLLVSSRRQGLGHVDAALTKLGRHRKIQMRVQHYMVAPQIVLETDLALSAPLRLARGYDLRIVELPFEVPPLGLHLYWHRSADRDQGNQWFRDRLLQLAGVRPGPRGEAERGSDSRDDK